MKSCRARWMRIGLRCCRRFHLYHILSLWGVSLAPASADDSPPQRIYLLTEYITLEHRKVVAMVREHMQAGTHADELRSKLQRMLDTGTATLDASTVTMATNSGGKSASFNERIYATEWDPPNSIQEINGDFLGNPDILTNVFPSAFDTRHEGIQVEFTAILGKDGCTIDVDFASEIVTQNGRITIGKEEGMITQPAFESQLVSTSQSLTDGHYALIAMHTPSAGKKDHPNYTEPARTLLFLRASTSQISDDPDKRRFYPRNVGILVEFIEVNAADAIELTQIDTDRVNDQPIRDRVQQLIDGDRAKHLESSFLATRSGQRAKVQSIAELTYPTEMGGPPSAPHTVHGSVSRTANVVTSQAYTAFETRNLGTTFEVDPVLGSNRTTVDINLAPEIAELVAWETFGKPPAEVVQPIIASLGLSTAIASTKGNAVLAAMQTPVDKNTRKRRDSRRVLMFITSSVKEVTK